MPRTRILLVVLLLCAAAACSGSSRSTPSPVAENGFHIEYDVIDDRGIHSREVTDVDRPYRARTIRYSDAQHKHSVGGAAWTETGVYTIRPDGVVLQATPAWPAPPGPDAHLDVALPVALRQHLVERAASGTVLGKPCTVWRSLRPLDGADFAPPTATEHTTSCVSDDGVVLRDDWQQRGSRLRAREAVGFGSAPRLTDGELLGGQPTPLPAELASYSITPSTEAELTRLIPVPDPAPPAGLHSDRAVAVLEVDHSSGTARITQEGAVLTWVGHGHLVQARWRRALLGAPLPAPTTGAAVALGRLGSGRLTPLLTGLQVEVLGPGGLLLTVKSDLPEDQLLSWVRSLAWST